MIDIEASCKICHKPVFLKADPDCEQNWLNVFLSCVCCDRCFDLREDRNRVTGKLQAICQWLLAIDATRLEPAAKKLKRDKARERLTYWTRQYAEWFSRFHGVPSHVIWSDDFAQLILEKPEKVDQVLGQYRSHARPLLSAREA